MGFWIQTGALLLSAIGALWIVLSRSRSERKRATVDLMLHQTQDKDLMDAKKKILELHEGGVSNFAQYLEKKDSAEYDTLVKILNTHEFVAAGIREGAYAEKLYKRMWFSATIKDWKACQGFVAEFRRKYNCQTLWQEFEWLADKWERSPLKKIKK
ncbi:MAG TPA: DUF4760 domain-containing protein [Candidatus Angelobacter sp.]|nr:DUF4760 domain-containing protein [Candidatus Angelobacter sp.]